MRDLMTERPHRRVAPGRSLVSRPRRQLGELGHVLAGQAIPGAPALDAILEHVHTERAGNGERAGAGRLGLGDSGFVDPLAGGLLHEAPRATGATAKAPLARLRHLDEREAGNALEDVARRIV